MLLGRYATDWLRRKPIRPSASLSSLACRPLSSVNTFRSTLPGRYGHGLGFVTKNLGKRNGALTRPPHSIVTQRFMLPVNAEEKTLAASNSTDGRQCPAKTHKLSREARARRGNRQPRGGRRH